MSFYHNLNYRGTASVQIFTAPLSDMIFTLYIFDSNGYCIFYKEWTRKRHLKMAQDEVCS